VVDGVIAEGASLCFQANIGDEKQICPKLSQGHSLSDSSSCQHFFLINVIIIVGMRAINFAEHYHRIKVEGEPSQWFPVAILRPKNNFPGNSEIDVIFLLIRTDISRIIPRQHFCSQLKMKEFLTKA
jgi:hypothetical protein